MTHTKFFAKLLAPIVGHNKHHVQNSAQFVTTLANLKLDPNDILVSFDVESLFTNIPIQDSMDILKDHFEG
ncbi:hypothetical protein J437_LFUL000727, partial [Ladona fulva]